MDTPQFPGFEIIETMPRGGMSTVYKVRQFSLDRIVALKTLPLTLAAESVDINQFLDEARITANLKHPNIVQVYDFGKTAAGIYYFVMEFISGYSVGDWIRRKQRLSEENALLVAQSVADALGYAWKTAGVVHCDIKPDNLIIDGDGTVKVADLGLAKSVRSVVDRAKVSTGMVFGTPNYISPEQSRGDVDLDCRADIYSLGCTLYHCLAGKMPFDGVPALTAMDLQITDQIPDVQDVNHRISVEAACLLEKMLAKDRDARQANWDGVMVDIRRVMRHQMPAGELPAAGASTMRRSTQRTSRPRVKAAISAPIQIVAGDQAPDSTAFQNMERKFLLKQKQKKGMKPEWWFAGAITLAVIVLAILVMRSTAPGGRTPVAPGKAGGPGVAPPPGITETSAPAAPAPVSAGDARVDKSREMFEVARKFVQENPRQVAEALRQYRKVANETRGTRYSLMALMEIEKLQESNRRAAEVARESSQQGVEAVMRDLALRAAPLIASNEFARAAEFYEKYEGEWAAESAQSRGNSSRNLRERDRDLRERDRDMQDRQRKAVEELDRQWRQLVDQVCARLFEGDVPDALAQLKQAAELPQFASRKKDIAGLDNLLTEASRMNQRILNAFLALKDKQVTVTLLTGPETVTVRGVEGETIQVEKIVVMGAGQIIQPKSFQIADLAPSEKRLRLSPDNRPETALLMGLLSAQDRDWAAAESCFANTDPLLSAALLARLGELKSTQNEEQAKRELLGILRNAKIDVAQNAANCEGYRVAIMQKKFAAREAQLLAKAVDRYRAAYGQTKFAAEYAPVLDALANVPMSAPPPGREAAPPVAAPQPAKAATPQAAAKQPLQPGASPEAVKANLLELNPRVESAAVVFRQDGAGKVVRVEIFSAWLTDIRSLAVLTDVREILCCGPAWGQYSFAPLADISPLKGLPLRELDISRTMVKDLSPLVGMPLNKLTLARTKVTDIASLKGLPLIELNIEGTRVKDISALRGMPLKRLNLNDTEVADVTALQGLPLEYLYLARSKAQDLAALNGLSLTSLDIGGSAVKDCAALKNMPLRELMMSRVKLMDFSFLSTLKLGRLDVSGTDFRDLSVLKGMPLRELNMSGTKIKDQDLAALQGLPMERLHLNNTEIKDLGQLKNVTTLKCLSIAQTRVKDLSPIQELPIESLWLDYDWKSNDKFWSAMRLMPNLRDVNGQPWGAGGRGGGGGPHRRR